MASHRQKIPFSNSKPASTAQTSSWHLNRVNQNLRRLVNTKTLIEVTDKLTEKRESQSLVNRMGAMAGCVSFASCSSPQILGA